MQHKTADLWNCRSENHDLFTPSSVARLVIVIVGDLRIAATAHYRKVAWGDPWQPIGWLLSMFFLLLAFLPDPRELARQFQVSGKSKSSILSLLDPVFCSLAPLEFPHRAMERRRTF